MENQNSVCYVGVIGEVKPIVGADNIEQVLVGGWNAITKKGEYQSGDKVVVAKLFGSSNSGSSSFSIWN